MSSRSRVANEGNPGLEDCNLAVSPGLGPGLSAESLVDLQRFSPGLREALGPTAVKDAMLVNTILLSRLMSRRSRCRAAVLMTSSSRGILASSALTVERLNRFSLDVYERPPVVPLAAPGTLQALGFPARHRYMGDPCFNGFAPDSYRSPGGRAVPIVGCKELRRLLCHILERAPCGSISAPISLGMLGVFPSCRYPSDVAAADPEAFTACPLRTSWEPAEDASIPPVLGKLVGESPNKIHSAASSPRQCRRSVVTTGKGKGQENDHSAAVAPRQGFAGWCWRRAARFQRSACAGNASSRASSKFPMP